LMTFQKNLILVVPARFPKLLVNHRRMAAGSTCLNHMLSAIWRGRGFRREIRPLIFACISTLWKQTFANASCG
jgi:hypothetical protein